MEKKDLDWGNLSFAYMHTDYSYVCNYKDGAWEEGGLTPDHTVTLSECAGLLHYCQEVFEGLKAYTTENGDIVCFRPDMNAQRMYDSAARLEMPSFPKDKFVEAVEMVVRANAAWVPPFGSGAPLVNDHLCGDCAEHYAAVKRYLDEAGVSYTEDPTLVRGLDYYTRTVFEVEVEGAGVGAIGGGGRYDGLMELEGGKPTPGIGFAVGFERIALALASQGVELATPEPACVYVAGTGAEERDAVFAATLALRGAGIRTEADYQGRSLKSQFKQADKLHATYCVVLGPEEVAAGVATVRDMATHDQVQVPLADLAAEVAARLA